MVPLWGLAVASVPAVAWLLLRRESESDEVKKQERRSAARSVKGERLLLDTAVQRRFARQEFYRKHKNFDFNVHSPFPFLFPLSFDVLPLSCETMSVWTLQIRR